MSPMFISYSFFCKMLPSFSCFSLSSVSLFFCAEKCVAVITYFLQYCSQTNLFYYPLHRRTSFPLSEVGMEFSRWLVGTTKELEKKHGFVRIVYGRYLRLVLQIYRGQIHRLQCPSS